MIPLQGSYDIQIGQFTVQDLRLQIKTLLFADEPQDSMGVQPQTAYELSLKQQNLAQKIGPLFSRLQHEFLWPVLKRFAYILNTMGKLPYPKLEGVPIRFKYKSPLALVKGQQDVAKLIQWTQTMQGLYGPEATQVYLNPKTVPYLLAESLQLDSRLLNTPMQVQQTMQQLQDKVSEQEQQMQAQGIPQSENPTGQFLGNG